MKVKCISIIGRDDRYNYSTVEVGQVYEIKETFTNIIGEEMYVFNIWWKSVQYRSSLFEAIE